MAPARPARRRSYECARSRLRLPGGQKRETRAGPARRDKGNLRSGAGSRGRPGPPRIAIRRWRPPADRIPVSASRARAGVTSGRGPTGRGPPPPERDPRIGKRDTSPDAPSGFPDRLRDQRVLSVLSPSFRPTAPPSHSRSGNGSAAPTRPDRSRRVWPRPASIPSSAPGGPSQDLRLASRQLRATLPSRDPLLGAVSTSEGPPGTGPFGPAKRGDRRATRAASLWSIPADSEGTLRRRGTARAIRKQIG
jgi:hypothetical protein